MHARRFLLPLVLAATLASCQMGSMGPYGTNGNGTGSMGGTNAFVGIYDTYLTPISVTIGAGKMVTWYNYGASSHSVTGTSGPVAFDSGTIAAGGTFSFTFTMAGSYSYSGPGGTGMITVNP
jgi:plastocyanin